MLVVDKAVSGELPKSRMMGSRGVSFRWAWDALVRADSGDEAADGNRRAHRDKEVAEIWNLTDCRRLTVNQAGISTGAQLELEMISFLGPRSARTRMLEANGCWSVEDGESGGCIHLYKQER